MKADHKRAYRTLCKIVKQEGVSVAYVTASIEQAAREAWADAQSVGALNALKMWDFISKTGEFPSAVEILAYMGKQYKQR